MNTKVDTINILVVLWSVFFVLDILYIYLRKNGLILLGIFNIFIFYYFIFIYFGSLILLLKFDTFSVEILGMVNDKTLRILVFLTTIFFLFAIMAALLADYIFGIKKDILIKWIKKDIISFSPNNDKFIIIPIIFFFLMSIIIFIYYLSKIPLIPILGVFLNIGPMRLRAEAVGDLFEGKIWWYRYFYLNIPIFLSFVIIIEGFQNKSYLLRLLRFLLILYCFFINIFDVQKAPLLFYLFFLFLIYHYIHKKNVKINFKNILMYTIMALSLLTTMYIYFMGRDFSIAIVEGFHRVFTGQLQGLYGIIENFTNRPLYGRTLPPFLLKVFGLDFYNLDKEMKLYIHKYINPNSSIIGLAPTVYFGEVYANFGLIACFLSMFLIPFILRSIDCLFIKRIDKSSLSIGLYIYMMWHYKNLVLGRLSPFIFDISVVLILFIYFILLLIKNFINLLKHRREPHE